MKQARAEQYCSTHLLCCARTSTWVVLSKIAHCRFVRTKSDDSLFNRLIFYYFLMSNCNQTVKTKYKDNSLSPINCTINTRVKCAAVAIGAVVFALKAKFHPSIFFLTPLAKRWLNIRCSSTETETHPVSRSLAEKFHLKFLLTVCVSTFRIQRIQGAGKNVRGQIHLGEAAVLRRRAGGGGGRRAAPRDG